MKCATRITVLLAVSLLFTPSPATSAEAGAPQINEAQRLVFMNDFLHDVAAGSVIHYEFAHQGRDVEAFTDRVTLTVTGVADEGRRDLEFDFLSGDNHLDFHPAKAYKGNPVMIHFLEWDIQEMARDTGGNIAYFRNRIRKSFRRAELRNVEINFHGGKVEGVEVMVVPFVDDPNIGKFEKYENKRYDFRFSDDVPGGLYQIRTTVPGAHASDALIENVLTFHDMTSPG